MNPPAEVVETICTSMLPSPVQSEEGFPKGLIILSGDPGKQLFNNTAKLSN